MGSLLWTFPILLLASVVVGWAAELTAVYLSAGMALAVLAWLQTAPEFSVEATIAWHQEAPLALANLTGSLRLLLGFGWPVIFLIHWFSQRNKRKIGRIELPHSFSVEALGLLPPVLYFFFIYFKGTWGFWDGLVLCSFYGFYFWLLNLQRKVNQRERARGRSAEDDESWVVQAILKLPKTQRLLITVGLFLLGGVVLIFVAHPFVEGLKQTATSLGISEFVFIQWIAPIASEFPEKVTAFNWARKADKAPMAIVNMLASVTSQWTLLAGLVPIIFSISAGHLYTIELSEFQKLQILLTIAQSTLAVVFLADLRIEWYESIGLLLLWVLQLVAPHLDGLLVGIYFVWAAVECLHLAFGSSKPHAWKNMKRLFVKQNEIK